MNLKTLLLAGQFVEESLKGVDSGMFKPLTVLHRLRMSPHGRLPNASMLPATISVLDLQWGNVGSTILTNTMLAPFSSTTIKELSFHACDIHQVENGTFTNLVNLTLVNVACNYYLRPDVIIDALSTSFNHSVKSLILDGTNMARPPGWTIGWRDRFHCRAVWKSLTRLSIRGVDLMRMVTNMSRCLVTLQQLSMGYNRPVMAGRINNWMSLLEIFPQNLLTLNLDYFLTVNNYHEQEALRCNMKDGTVPLQNSEYFPPVEYDLPCKCDIPYVFNGTAKQTLFPPSQTSCGTVRFPTRCLQFIDVSHLTLARNRKRVGCVHLPFAHLRHLNVSTCVECSKRIEGPIYGLDNLESLDMSHWDMVYFRSTIINNMPKLQKLWLQGNKLGINGIVDFPIHRELRELYLDDNSLRLISASAFINLSNLTILSLRGNILSELSFISEELKYLNNLDLSSNQFTFFPTNSTHILDQISKQTALVINIRYNPLQCGCNELAFTKWIHTTGVLIRNKDTLHCDAGEHVRFVDINIVRLKQKCENLYQILSAAIAVPLLLFIICLVCYRYRWFIKWKYYVLKRMLTPLGSVHCTNACLIYAADYPNDDDFATMWITRKLRPLVEDQWLLNLWFYERDAMIGEYPMINMVDGIKKSRAAIWIMTPQFLKNHLCINAANFAILHYGAARNLIIQFHDQALDLARVDKGLLSLMDPKMGIRRVKVSPRDTNDRCFNDNLQRFLLDDSQVEDDAASPLIAQDCLHDHDGDINLRNVPY